ncbi:MAG: KH domain-containing protein [Oscillospiraceae bacterium]|nr:KH domain-containing protein [Oscillospiraceae bacterium]
MKELLQYLVEQMVDDPGSISITEAEKEGRLVYELRVAPEDMGKVIGRSGFVARDLRTLIKASSAEGQRVTVDIIN